MARLPRLLHRLSALALAASALPATLAAADDTALPVAPNAVYLQPMAGLSADELRQFRSGETMFRTVWLIFPAMPVQNNWQYMRPRGGYAWGLGPTYIANACMACHVQGGSGKTSDKPGASVFQQLLRISIPGTNPHGGPNPHPVYGDQLQVFDVISADRRQAREGEADVLVDWQPEVVTLADGSRVELRRPQIRITGLSFGPLGPDVMTSLRNTPAIFGLGYLESVSEEDILALAEAQKAQGLNGRPNYVNDDSTGRKRLGRFGWKANQPSISQQVAAAHLGDMGITSSLYPDDDCTGVQVQCLNFGYKKGKPELTDAAWRAVNHFMAATEAPGPRRGDDAQLRRGGQLFREMACAVCHVPEMKAGRYAPLPVLEGERFQAYTDLLLHDMGEALADGRPDFLAGGRDWRTAPLWGIGVSARVNGSTDLLHDGRARNVTEAILWHGGEAQRARDAFARLDSKQRAALIAFVHSL